MINLTKLATLICLLLCLANAAKKLPKIKLDRVKCSSTLCESFNCVVTRKSSHTQVLDGFCNLREPVVDVYAHAQLFYRYTRYVPFLYDIHVDVCDFLGSATKFQPLLTAVRHYLERNTMNVMNQTCPARGNISVVEMQYDMDLIKDTIVPIGQYRADMRVYIKSTNITIFDSHAYLSKLHEVPHKNGRY